MLPSFVRRVVAPLQLLVATITLAGPGDPDPTFGKTGRVVTAFPGGLDTANGVAVQPDGKIIVVGTSGSDFALTRYNPDGALDPTFGGGGRIHSHWGLGGGSAANGVLLQPDGRIVLVGSTSNRAEPSAVALARYNPDGTLHQNFASLGLASIRFTDDDVFGHAVARQSDGKLVVAGRIVDANGASKFLVVRYHSDGRLDQSFGGGFAHVTTDFPDSADDTAHAIAIQADGKIVVAGEAGGAFAVVRYNPDGSLDSLFDGDGMSTTSFDEIASAARGVVIQLDGKIVAAGRTAGNTAAESNFALARYNLDGSLDITFDGDGKVIGDFGSREAAHAAVLQPDGRIIAAGVATNADGASFFALARYLPTGTIDDSFGGTGTVLTDFSGGRLGRGAAAVALQADGRIVAAGDANFTGQRDFGLVRYNIDGSLDNSLDGDGKVSTDFRLNEEAVTAIVVQPDRKIVAVGRAQLRSLVPDAQDPNFLLARYNPDGTLDSTFGDGGIVSTDFGVHGHDYAHAVALQPDGRIIVVGQVGPAYKGISDAYTQFGVARYNPDGTLDTTFGGDGLVTTNVGPSPFARARAVAIQDDGRIVVAGTSTQFTLVRYHSNGSVDASGFGSGGIVTTAFGGSFSSAAAILIQPDGRIIAGGVANTGSGIDFAIARYDANGALDPSFDNDGKVTTDFESRSDGINALAVQPDGKLVAGGATTGENGVGLFALARYDLNTGSLDGAFGDGGRVMTDTGRSASINSVALGTDGRIVVAGVSARLGPPTYAFAQSLFAVARYRLDGSLDPSFGTDGIVTAGFAFGADSHANAIVVRPDGNLIVGGFTDNGSSRDFALLGLLYDPPARLLNISTRLHVGTADERTLIGGFIITGTQPKKVVVRALGPSLGRKGVSGTLEDPVLELFDSTGTMIAQNDDGFNAPPGEFPPDDLRLEDFRESAIMRTLQPGSYTGIVRGKFGRTGVALVEVYDAGLISDSQLANISSRGFVQTGENVLIGGFIAGDAARSARIVVRAIGPSLQSAGVAAALADPTIDLFDANGAVVRSNDNWKDSQRAELEATGLQPTDDLESALIMSLPPADYTAIVRGKDDTSGVGTVEVYNLQ